MAHECEYCGMECYCDCDDLGGQPQPNSCRHLMAGLACSEAATELNIKSEGDAIDAKYEWRHDD